MIYHETEHGVLYCGDCLDVMRGLPDNSVDSIVTDPPYGLSFMGRKWDYDVPSVEIWQECLRILKPGGHLLAFAGTRTQHRMAVRIEDAGFEIRDMIAWVYGSGFPKSLNIGKAVDKLQGNERETVGKQNYTCQDIRGNAFESERAKERPRLEQFITQGNTPYEGWGTALKPALEPITVARKPISEKNIAENVLRWGTGGVNVDRCRVEHFETPKVVTRTAIDKFWQGKRGITKPELHMGRFPANLIHDGSDEVMECFPETGKSTLRKRGKGGYFTGNKDNGDVRGFEEPAGSAARFFYRAKASKAERDAGCEDLPIKRPDNRTDTGMGSFAEKGVQEGKNHHPTVKPKALMQYLCRLITPKGGTVLEPFAGSGTTLCSIPSWL